MKKFANGKPIILVLGNEETGVSNVVLENCDKLVVLGDLVNGPNNNPFYDSSYVVKFLNSFHDNIVCLKG